jgi:hypothetical protein
MTRQLRWILASLAISATAGAQAIPNTTSNGSASPSTGICPPGSINCIPGATQQGTTPEPLSPQQQLGPQPVVPPTSATTPLGTPPTTPVPAQPGATLPDTSSPGLGTNTLPGNGTNTLPGNGTNTLPGNGTSTLPGSTITGNTATLPGSTVPQAVTLPGSSMFNTPIVPNATPPR